MNSSQLEAWAVRMAAQNRNPSTQFTPVLLYRDGEPFHCGALSLYENGERIITAAHGFSVDRPPFICQFRRLLPKVSSLQLISKVEPLRRPEDDVALCTPGSVLEVVPMPLPTFYTGYDGSPLIDETFKFISFLSGNARSVLTGVEVRVLAEVKLCGAAHVVLDYSAMPGQSGSVFVDEQKHCMYVLRGYSKDVDHPLRRFTSPGRRLRFEKGMAFAIRLKYA